MEGFTTSNVLAMIFIAILGLYALLSFRRKLREGELDVAILFGALATLVVVVLAVAVVHLSDTSIATVYSQ